MNAKRINVLPATSEPGEILHIEDSVALEPFSFSDLEFSPVSELSYQLQVIPANEGVVLMGELLAKLSTACVRCLEDAVLEVKAPFEEEYYFDERFDSEGEPFPRIDDEGYIDISNELFESLIIAMPFAPLCGDDCGGLCPKCGINLNEDSCECHALLDENHPFAKLGEMIKSDEE